MLLKQVEEYLSLNISVNYLFDPHNILSVNYDLLPKEDTSNCFQELIILFFWNFCIEHVASLT